MCCSSSWEAEKPQLWDHRHDNCHLHLVYRQRPGWWQQANTHSPHTVCNTNSECTLRRISVARWQRVSQTLVLSITGTQTRLPSHVSHHHVLSQLCHNCKSTTSVWWWRTSWERKQRATASTSPREVRGHANMFCSKNLHKDVLIKYQIHFSCVCVLVFPVVEWNMVRPEVTDATLSWHLQGNFTEKNVYCEVSTIPGSIIEVKVTQVVRLTCSYCWKNTEKYVHVFFLLSICATEELLQCEFLQSQTGKSAS